MSDRLVGVRMQDSLPARTSDGDVVNIRANNRGEIVMIDQYQQWVADGVVFQANNAALETGTLSVTTFASGGTNPFFSCTVPSGTTMIPLEVSLTQDGSAAGNAWDLYMGYENADLFSSGGTAVSVNNMRTDDPKTTSLTNVLTTATLTAPTDDRVIHSGIYTQNVDDPKHSDDSFYWTARKNIAPILVGASTFYIYAWVTGTAPTLFFRVVWAEFNTTQVT